jgi:magnesium-transporting ATPase (P-type)
MHFLAAILCNIFLILLLLLALILAILGLLLALMANDWAGACFAWLIALGLLLSALMVAIFTALVNRHKDKQFDRLQCLIDKQYHAVVIRNGAKHEVESRHVVVGDLFYVSYGMILPADGILIESNDLVVDESCLTGSGRCAQKCPGQVSVRLRRFYVVQVLNA